MHSGLFSWFLLIISSFLFCPCAIIRSGFFNRETPYKRKWDDAAGKRKTPLFFPPLLVQTEYFHAFRIEEEEVEAISTLQLQFLNLFFPSRLLPHCGHFFFPSHISSLPPCAVGGCRGLHYLTASVKSIYMDMMDIRGHRGTNLHWTLCCLLPTLLLF